jgi:flagellin-like hook-associated protein FlgL
MNGALSLRFTAQAQLDVRRITRELSELQRQVASGSKANDLRGLGGEAAQVLNASTMRAAADARASALNQLEARFGVQAAALNQAAAANQNLANSIRDAISANDGRGVATELNLSFISAVAAMNETWNGQPMFAGERQSGPPIRVASLEALETATGSQLFDEADRPQILDLGAGSPLKLADKASELSTEMFDAMRELHLMIEGMGGEIGQPIDAATTDQLIAFAERFEAVSGTFTNAEGRTGQLAQRFAGERTRQVERSNLLTKEIGERADADVAMISIRMSTLLVQYEAAAKTFGDLSKLSLLDYI